MLTGVNRTSGYADIEKQYDIENQYSVKFLIRDCIRYTFKRVKGKKKKYAYINIQTFFRTS
jgi:hypothetical protein